MRLPAPALLLVVLLLPLVARADGPPALNAFGDAFPANAPPMPVCNAPREGVAACLAGRQCLCRYERGGSITGRPDGFRWDCGILRPSCAEVPADLGPPVPAPAIFPQVTVPGMGSGMDSGGGEAPGRFR